MGNSNSGGDGVTLPPEVYLHIASFLEVGDVGAVSLVSREWHGVVEQDAFWRGLYIRHFVFGQGRRLLPSGPRIAAWPSTKKPSSSKKKKETTTKTEHESADELSASESEGEDDGGMWGRPDNADTRARMKEQAQAHMMEESTKREAEERKIEEHLMARIRREAGDDASWRSCFRRRIRMKDGVCLIFLVGGNSLPYAADMVEKLRLHDVKVNSVCTIQLPYDGSGPHKGWQEELRDHLQRHSVAIFFANIAGADTLVRAYIGNQMATFVEEGGSVVLAAFATCNAGESPGGMWQGRNYYPILLNGQTSVHVKLELNSENVDHRLYHGVRQAYVSYHGLGQAHPAAKVFGRWSDKTPAMARLKAKKGTIISVNFFPPSSDIGDGGWPKNGTGWVQKNDNSSARVWMYQFLERLSVRQAQEAEGGEAGDDVAMDMTIPPELVNLFRQVDAERGEGEFPWGALLEKIEQDDDAAGEQGEDKETLEEGNDAMVMLANAVQYGLWKASRPEPRAGTPEANITEVQEETHQADAAASSPAPGDDGEPPSSTNAHQGAPGGNSDNCLLC